MTPKRPSVRLIKCPRTSESINLSYECERSEGKFILTKFLCLLTSLFFAHRILESTHLKFQMTFFFFGKSEEEEKSA